MGKNSSFGGVYCNYLEDMYIKAKYSVFLLSAWHLSRSMYLVTVLRADRGEI